MKANLFTSAMSLGIVFCFLAGNVAISKVMAESGVGNDVFKVVVSLYGITNSTKDIITIVNVHDSTKIKLFDPQNSGTEGSDKVSYVFTYPGVSVDSGERYNVCTVGVTDFKLKCEHGNNSPLNRPEFVDINVSEKAGEKGSENPSKKVLENGDKEK